MGTQADVVISYAHADAAWKDHLCLQLGVLQQAGRLSAWDDQRIAIGGDWRLEIDAALAAARVALLLVSPHFLTSRFIADVEIPTLLKRREQDGLRVIPIIVQPCAWRHITWLACIQTHPRDGTPLAGMSKYDADVALVALVLEVQEIVGSAHGTPPSQEHGAGGLALPAPGVAHAPAATRAQAAHAPPSSSRGRIGMLTMGCAALSVAALLVGMGAWSLWHPSPTKPGLTQITPGSPQPSPSIAAPPARRRTGGVAPTPSATTGTQTAEPVRVRAAHLLCTGVSEVCALLVPQLVEDLHDKRIPTLSDEHRALARVVLTAKLVESRADTVFGNPVEIRTYSIAGEARLGSEGAVVALDGGLVQGDLVLGRETFTERLRTLALAMGDSLASVLP